MKKLVIKSQRGKNMVANLLAKKVRGAVSLFSEAPTVEVKEECDSYTTISIYNKHSHMLTFPEIDVVRAAVDQYKDKYELGSIGYTMQTKPYLSQNGKYFLHMPVMKITVRWKNW